MANGNGAKAEVQELQKFRSCGRAELGIQALARRTANAGAEYRSSGVRIPKAAIVVAEP